MVCVASVMQKYRSQSTHRSYIKYQIVVQNHYRHDELGTQTCLILHKRRTLIAAAYQPQIN